MLFGQAFTHRFRVDGDDNMARLSFQRSIHNGDVTTEDPRAGHAVPLDTYQVHVRRTQIKKLVERDLLLEMVGGR